jgi:hypothetical protein
VLASVNDAEVNGPVTPVMSAPAAAFVEVAQFFARWSHGDAYENVTRKKT